MDVETYLNSSVLDILKILVGSGNNHMEAVLSGDGKPSVKITITYEEVADDTEV